MYFRKEKCIVLNSRSNNEWGEEEIFQFPGISNVFSDNSNRNSNSNVTNNTSTNRNSSTDNKNLIDHLLNMNPLSSGEFFMLYLMIGVDSFHIAINNRSFCTFKYRFPVQELRTIELREQIQVIKQIDHRSIYPNPWPSIQASDYFKSFSNDIPILFRVGHLIVITAHCFNNKRGQFIIKFMESDTKREQLHFSVRYDQQVVVRNSMLKNFE